MFNIIFDHFQMPLQLYMVVGLTGASVQTAAFRVGSVTTRIQRMVDCPAMVTTKDPVQPKLLKHWAATATHVSIIIVIQLLNILLYGWLHEQAR